MKIGDIVSYNKKTGKYIGEISAVLPDMYTIRTLAVLRHPKQGDLHNPNEADVPFFHERKALAFREQVNIDARSVKEYAENVPEYTDSLNIAVRQMVEALETDSDDPYQQRALQTLLSVVKEYELMYSMTFDFVKR